MFRVIRLSFIMIFLVFSVQLGWAQSPLSPPEINNSGKDQSVDPTKNVLDLVGALKEMLRELRVSDRELFEAKMKGVEKFGEALALHNKELRESAVQRIDSESKLRSDFSEKLSFAEAKRIDAIRLVDVGAAATLAQRTTEQATALATVVTQSAEVLRNQVSRAAEDTRALVATTATTALQNQQQQFQAITTRLAALEQTGAEGKGRQLPPDPAFAAMIARSEALEREIRSLRESRSTTTGTDAGRNDTYTWLLALGAFILALFMGFIAYNKQPTISARTK